MAVKPTPAPAHQPPGLLSLCFAITEHAPLPMATVEGASHIVRYVNPAFCRLMDEPRKELVGKPFAEMMPKKDECVTLLDRVFRTGKSESHTERQHSKPHPVFWSYTMWPVLADERPVGVMIQVTETAQFHEKTVAMNEALMLGSVRQHELTEAAESLNAQLQMEITERKQAEQRVRRSELRYRRLFEVTKDGILILDPETRKITEANPFIIEFLGYPREQLLGKELWEIGLLKDKEASQKAFLELKAKGFIRYESLPLETKADQRREVEFISNLYQENSEAVIQCNIRDVTDRKKTEQELSEKARLLDLSNDAIIVHDLDDKISSWNKGAEELYGWTSEEVIGKHLDSLLQMEFPKPMEEIVAQLQSEGHFSGEVVQIARDGRRVAALCRWVLDRGTESILTSYTDITERKRAEEALREARTRLADYAGQLEGLVTERTAELTATNKQLEAFVYTIAHDLRAPLRSMQGFSAMLVEDAGAALGETGRDFANRINKSAQFMDALLQDLLAVSRIAQERIELTSVNLKTVVQSVLSRLENEIQEKNGRVEIAGPWPTVLAHAPTLGQVLFNLASNALKFVAPGVKPHIRLRAEEGIDGLMDERMNAGQPSTNPSIHSSSHPAPGFVRVWVEDNGIGIAPEHQEQIFRLFTRLNGDKFPGTGIGLAIVQKGVERMDGNVGLESTPEQGSRFWIELRKAEQNSGRMD